MSSILDCGIYNSTYVPIIISGGTISYDGIYTIHSFTTTGTSYFYVSGSSITIDYLMIGGGGGGGSSNGGYGGGGGAGGLLTGSTKTLLPGSYSIVVGSGGTTSVNGMNTTFSGLTCVGGGKGASSSAGAGGAGGSGGGGCTYRGAKGNPTSLQGYSGGLGSDGGWTSNDVASGGGGGSGGVGFGGGATNASQYGGDAYYTTIRGTEEWFGAGGAGCGRYYGERIRNIGGATQGFIPAPPYTTWQSYQDTNGTNGTGSGGGGGRKGFTGTDTTNGGKGGHGIVIIKHLT